MKKPSLSFWLSILSIGCTVVGGLVDSAKQSREIEEAVDERLKALVEETVAESEEAKEA